MVALVGGPHGPSATVRLVQDRAQFAEDLQLERPDLVEAQVVVLRHGRRGDRAGQPALRTGEP
jgi:hypothetical protein